MNKLAYLLNFYAVLLGLCAVSVIVVRAAEHHLGPVAASCIAGGIILALAIGIQAFTQVARRGRH